MANARINLDRALKTVLRAVPRADYSACLTLIRSLIERLPEDPLAARFFTPSQVAKYLPRSGKGEPCLIRRALEFTPDERDGLLSSLLDTLGRKRPNRQVSRVSELLPWLNEISQGEFRHEVAQWLVSNEVILPSAPRCQ